MTCLGFNLNIALLVIKDVNTVLTQDQETENAILLYVDDLVNESLVGVELVSAYFPVYVLECKQPE